MKDISLQPKATFRCYCCPGIIQSVVGISPQELSHKATFSCHCCLRNIHSVVKISPRELADHITYTDLHLFKAIELQELSGICWMKQNKEKTAPNIVKFCNRFNAISYWAVQEILRAETATARAQVISHLLKLAQEFNKRRNLHGQFALMAAFQCASVSRLKETWTNVPAKDRKVYGKMERLFDPQKNFSKLRKFLKAKKLPCIPFLGIFQSDLVFIDTVNPLNKTGENEERSKKMQPILHNIEAYQKSIYPLPNDDITISSFLNQLTYDEGMRKTMEDKHYKRSLELEPKKSTKPSNIDSVEDVSSKSSSTANPGDASKLKCLKKRESSNQDNSVG